MSSSRSNAAKTNRKAANPAAPKKGAIGKKKATAKKPRRAPTKRKQTVLASWTEGYQPFVDDCRESFVFLIRERGFTPGDVVVIPPECSVSFVKGRQDICIMCEYCGPPWVVVAGGDPRKSYGLDEFVEELLPEYRRRKPEAPSIPEPAQRKALLDYHATFLREHADRILSGDPALLARLESRRRRERA
jgi:hypothetical protein